MTGMGFTVFMLTITLAMVWTVICEWYRNNQSKRRRVLRRIKMAANYLRDI